MRTVLLIKAIEEVDARAELLSEFERDRATYEARTSGEFARKKTDEAFLETRARRLRAWLEHRYPTLHRVFDPPRLRLRFKVGMALASFILGAALNELGAEHRVSVLAFPLLGLFAWNLAIYAAMLLLPLSASIRAWHGRLFQRMQAFGGLFARDSPELKARSGEQASVNESRLLADALGRFAPEWGRFIAPLHAARLRALLHVCAALMALGTVAGMYLRGIAFEYRAGWESTFLDANTVHALLRWLLGPASVVTGIEIPNVAHIESLRWTSTQPGENAAGWIHLYAVTAALLVVIPRVALTLWTTARAAYRSRRSALPAEIEPYVRRLLVDAGITSPGKLTVMPYSYRLPDGASARLTTFFTRFLNEPIKVVLRPPIAYGGEDIRLTAFGSKSEYAALVFNMAATPEAEVHGDAIERFRRACAEQPDAARLLVIIDESRYREFGERLDERRRVWQDFVRARGIEAIMLDTSRDE